jgi:hypothetical protein
MPGPPILQPSTLRAWRVVTWVAMAGSGFQMIFRTDYGDKDHVFKPVSPPGLSKDNQHPCQSSQRLYVSLLPGMSMVEVATKVLINPEADIIIT